MIVSSILSLINMNTKIENILWTYLIALHVDKEDTLHWWVADEMVAVCSVLLCWGSPWNHEASIIILRFYYIIAVFFLAQNGTFGGVMTHDTKHDRPAYSQTWVYVSVFDKNLCIFLFYLRTIWTLVPQSNIVLWCRLNTGMWDRT